MTEHEDPHKLSDALQGEADRLERDSEELRDRVDSTRQDWERKRGDENVPGAPPPDGQGPSEPPDRRSAR